MFSRLILSRNLACRRDAECKAGRQRWRCRGKINPVRRLDMEDGQVVGQEFLFGDLGRFREVRVGPDGFYLLTDSPEGRVLRARL
ncbi:MAG: PQQ-dependent sugar dehydrogenase [Rhodospirillaceae bacterium]|jgi:glucose/arabinose dehydrogenase|nr:PQQ-dependent sugar dehydrogenase [Rhodospirillaceae bacterium]